MAGLAVMSLGVLSPRCRPAWGSAVIGVPARILARACAAGTLQRFISGGFLGNLAASMRKERSPDSFGPGGGWPGQGWEKQLSRGMSRSSLAWGSGMFQQALPSDSRKAFALELCRACRP